MSLFSHYNALELKSYKAIYHVMITESPAGVARLRGCFVYIVSTKLMTTASRSQMCGHIRAIAIMLQITAAADKKRRRGDAITRSNKRQDKGRIFEQRQYENGALDPALRHRRIPIFGEIKDELLGEING